MSFFSVLSVFGDLCSIYSAFKDSKRRDNDYHRKLAKCIVAIDLFKQVHTTSQAVREKCISHKSNGLHSDQITATYFQNMINEMIEAVIFFKDAKIYFAEDIYTPIKIETKETIVPFVRELNGITNATNSIIDLLGQVEPAVIEFTKWHLNWRSAKQSIEEDYRKYTYFLNIFENPARMMLMYSNMAIMFSVTLLKLMVVPLLEN